MKKNLLFKKIVALFCCIAMCIPMCVVGVNAADGYSVKLKTDGITFYDEDGLEIKVEDGGFGANYDCTLSDNVITFTGVDGASLAGQTIVLYANTDSDNNISIGSNLLSATANITRSASENYDWMIELKIPSRFRRDILFEAKTVKPQLNLTFSVTGDCTVAFDNYDEIYATAIMSYEKDSTVRFKVTPDNDGMQVVVKDGSDPKATDADGYYTVEVNKAKTIKISLEAKKPKVKKPAESTAYVFQGTSSVTYGNSYTFTVAPISGYDAPKVSYKQGDGTEVELTAAGNQYMIEEVTDDIEIIVVAGNKNSFNVTAPAAGDYTYYANTSTTVNKGGDFIFTVKSKPGFSAPTVSYKKEGSTVVTTLTTIGNDQYVVSNVESDIQIIVSGVSANKYTVHLPTGIGYEAKMEGETNEFGYNATASFTVGANTGYKIDSVRANGKILTLTDGKYSVNVTEDVEITVAVSKRSCSVELIYGSDDAAFAVTGSNTDVVYGDYYKFQVKPTAGYAAPTVEVKVGEETTVVTPVNGTQYEIQIKGDTTITITAGKSYKATCESKHVDFKETNNGDGKITFTLVPEIGYRVTLVTANNTPVYANNGVYTVYDVTSDLDIVVETVENELTINYVSHEAHHQPDVTSLTFKYTHLTDNVLKGIIDCSCGVHNCTGWKTADGKDVTLGSLKNLIEKDSDSVIIYAEFENTFGIALEALAGLENATFQTIKQSSGGYRIIFRAQVELKEQNPCLAELAEKVTVSSGMLLAQGSDVNLNNPDVKEAILSSAGPEDQVKVGNQKVVIYHNSDNYKLDEFVEPIIVRFNSSAEAPAVTAAGWLVLEYGETRVAIVGGGVSPTSTVAE